MAVRFIITPKGEELALLPRSEYERLAALAAEAKEEAADAATYIEAKADWEAAGRPVLPPEVSALLLKQKSRLAAARKCRGLSQETLAARAGIQQGYLSDLGTGRRQGAREPLEHLAEALDDPHVADDAVSACRPRTHGTDSLGISAA
jgi:ribosome-binding protein aMBF1 (putative translation factor)